MPIRISRTSQSILDYAGVIEYLLDANAVDAATKFSAAYDETLGFLSRFPDVGDPRPELSTPAGVVRVFPVRGFPNHLVYFRRGDDRVTILRVLHGSRQVTSATFPESP